MASLGRLRLHSLSASAQAEIRDMHKNRPWWVMLHYLGLYGVVALIWYLCVSVDSLAIWVLGIWWIAVVQHGLYVVHHDASHFGHFRSKSLTRWVGFALCVVPMFHHPEAWSFEQWRRRHVRHHQHLFTFGDPDYANRARRGDTTRAYSRLDLLRACVRTGLTSIFAFFRGRQDAVGPGQAVLRPGAHHHLRTLFRPFIDDPLMERERRIKLVAMPLMLVAVAWFGLWTPFFVLWILPMYTVYPALLHLMDLTEHNWQREDQSIPINSRSTAYGLLARVFITWYPRPYHREHHLFPGVLCPDLPRLARLLADEGRVAESRRGLGSLLDSVARAVVEGPR